MIKVGLVQINNSFSNQNYLPYSVGLLQAYAQKYLTDRNKFEFLLPIYKRIPIESGVNKLADAHIIFFSVYVWNFKLSLEMARQIKQKKPEVLIVFGGPHVPNKKTEEFLRKYPFIDIACHGEGELTAVSILENCSETWDNIPSISYIDSKGYFVQNPKDKKITDINTIPSPYLCGIFEPLMDENPDDVWLALWETNRGCPFSCSYCDWGSATQSKVLTYDLGRLHQEIDWFSKNRMDFVFCCDANFGIFPRDIEFIKYFAGNKNKYGYPKALSVQNTKNSSERTYNVEKIMADAGLNKGVALALQSLNRETLKSINRANISLKHFQELQRKFSADNIETFTDLILGLPHETYDTFSEGVSSVIESGQHNRIQFNNLSILPNAEMGDEEYQKKYGFLIVEANIINAHGSLTDKEEVYETQQLVVGTHSMPKEDWLRTRILSWMTALLHFDKLMQIPFIILHNNFAISYRELIERFVIVDNSSPILYEIRSFFNEKAINIQNGGSEFCASNEWLNILWPADELIFIKLCTGNKLTEFYIESENLLDNLLREKRICNYKSILHDAIFLNQSLIKLPFHNENLNLTLSHNILDVYNAALKGTPISISHGLYKHIVDRKNSKWYSWDDWCREVVWYGNKKGAYLYPVR